MHGGLSKTDLLPRYTRSGSGSKTSNHNVFVRSIFNLNNLVQENSFVRKNRVLKRLKKRKYLPQVLVLMLFVMLLFYRIFFISKSDIVSPNGDSLVPENSNHKQGSVLVTQDNVLGTYDDDDMKDSKLNMEKAKQLLLNQLYAKEQASLDADRNKDAVAKGINKGNDVKALKQSDEAQGNTKDDTNINAASPPFKKSQDTLDKQKSQQYGSQNIINDKGKAES